MYEFWYNYLEPKYGCFIVYIKADDIYKDIAEDFETRFDTSNYELNRPLPKAKTKKSNWITELGEKIMIKFVVLRAKTYNYLIDDGSENKKKQKTQKRVS